MFSKLHLLFSLAMLPFVYATCSWQCVANPGVWTQLGTNLVQATNCYKDLYGGSFNYCNGYYADATVDHCNWVGGAGECTFGRITVSSRAHCQSLCDADNRCTGIWMYEGTNICNMLYHTNIVAQSGGATPSTLWRFEQDYCECGGERQADGSACGGSCCNPECVHGVCAAPGDGTRGCACEPGWTGPACDIASCGGIAADDPAVCSGNGVCVGPETCKCPDFTQPDCATQVTCNGLVPSDPNVCSGVGVCVPPCDCGELYSGDACETPLCPINSGTASPLPPTLVESSFITTPAGVQLDIAVPTVSNRVSEKMWFNSHETTCSVPLPTLDLVSCQRLFQASLPWSTLLSGCGFTETIEGDNTIYRGVAHVQTVDEVADLRGSPVQDTRDYDFPIEFSFQSTVMVESNTEVFAPILLLAAVSGQNSDAASKTVSLTLRTSVQWPYLTDSATVQTDSIYVSSMNLAVDNAACASDGSVCEQDYTLDITLDPNDPNACRIDGTYDIQLPISCQSTATDCPLDGSEVGTVQLLLLSENICTTTGAPVQITGAPAFTAGRDDFVQGDDVQIGVSLSDGNRRRQDAPPISSSSFTDIVVTDGATTSFLYQNGAVTALGTEVGLTIDTSVATDPSFSFTPNDNVFPVPQDESRVFTVRMDLTLDFAVGRKRQVLSTSVNRGYDLDMTLRSSTSDEEEASSSVVTTSLLPLLVGA